MSFSRTPIPFTQRPSAQARGAARRVRGVLAGVILSAAMLTVVAAQSRADRSAQALFSPVLWTGWWANRLP